MKTTGRDSGVGGGVVLRSAVRAGVYLSQWCTVLFCGAGVSGLVESVRAARIENFSEEGALLPLLFL